RILVEGAFPDAWKKTLPDPRGPARSHEVRIRLPLIEVSNDGDLLSVRSPDGEMRAGCALLFNEMRSELVIDAVVASRREKAQVFLGQKRRVHVRKDEG